MLQWNKTRLFEGFQLLIRYVLEYRFCKIPLGELGDRFSLCNNLLDKIDRHQPLPPPTPSDKKIVPSIKRMNLMTTHTQKKTII